MFGAPFSLLRPICRLVGNGKVLHRSKERLLAEIVDCLAGDTGLEGQISWIAKGMELRTKGQGWSLAKWAFPGWSLGTSIPLGADADCLKDANRIDLVRRGKTPARSEMDEPKTAEQARGLR